MVLLLLFVFDAVVAYVVGCWLVLRLFVSGVFVCMCLCYKKFAYACCRLVVCVCVIFLYTGWRVEATPSKTRFVRQKIGETASRARVSERRLSGEAPLVIDRLPSCIFTIIVLKQI